MGAQQGGVLGAFLQLVSSALGAAGREQPNGYTEGLLRSIGGIGK